MTRRRAAAMVVLALVVAVGACGPSPRETERPTTPSPPHVAAPAPTPEVQPATSTTRFHGRAIFPDGSPAVGARVRVFDLFAKTDADSRIGAEVIVGADGRFFVEAKGDDARGVVYGVLPEFAYATASASPTDDVALKFAAGGAVSGRAYDADGRARPDIDVRLLRCDEKGRVATAPLRSAWARPEIASFCARTARTDATGRFRLAGSQIDGKCSVVVTDGPDGRRWRGDVLTFHSPGERFDCDVRIGAFPFDEPDPFHRVEGRVVALDGRPIAGARMLYGIIEEDSEDFSPDYHGDRQDGVSDVDGKFDLDLGPAFDRRERPVELCVHRAGFLLWRGVPPPGQSIEVRLVPWDPAARPARVIGVAVNPAGLPLSGVLHIWMLDELARWTWQDAFADEHGEFVVEGLWPGRRRVSIDFFRDGQYVDVAAGESRRLTFRLRRGATSPTDVDEESRRILQDRLQRASAKLAEDPSDEDAWFDVEHSTAALAALDEKRIRRPVVVRGIPQNAPVIEARRDGVVWRVEVRDGVARFPSLSVGGWKFAQDRCGLLGAPRAIDVVAGEGPQTIDFDAR